MKQKRLSDWYRHPKYYEAIFDTDTVREMDFLEQVNAWYGTGGQTFLEPACGAGRLIEEGVRRGYTLVGHDLSPEMLAFARKRLTPTQRKRAHLYEGRMETFCPKEWQGKVDLAFSLVSTFRYLDSEEAAVAHLESVRKLLKPGGVYVLGFHLTEYARTKIEHERWVGRVGDETVVCNTREWPPDRKLRRSRMRNRLNISGPRGDFLIETEWYFRTWDERQVDALLEKTGFGVMGLYGFETRIDQPLEKDSLRLDRVMVLGRS